MGIRYMQSEHKSTGSLLERVTRSLRTSTMKQRPVPTAEQKRALRVQRLIMRREELARAKEEEELAKTKEEEELAKAKDMLVDVPPTPPPQRKRKHSVEELTELMEKEVTPPPPPSTPPVAIEDEAYDSDATIVLDDSSDDEEQEPEPLTDREVRKARAYHQTALNALVKDEMGRWNYSLIHGKDCMKCPNGIPSQGIPYEEEYLVADDESSEDEDDNLGHNTLEQYWDIIVDDLILMPNNKLALDVFYNKVYSGEKLDKKIIHASPEEFATMMAMARFYSYYHPGATLWYGYRKTRMDHWDLVVNRYNSRKTARIQAGNHQGGPIASPKRVPFPHKRQATAVELEQSPSPPPSPSKKPRLSDNSAYLGIRASLKRHNNCGIRFSSNSIQLIDMPDDLDEEEKEIFLWL